MADFSEDVSRWATRLGARADLFVQVLAMEVVNRVKELTPVRTGFLRSNWTVIRRGDAEPKAGAVPDPNQALATVGAGDIVTVINPTVYARRIEYGFVGADSAGRTYHQQGRHMMTQTIAELPSIASRVISQLGGRG
jgi:hypothetical protein